MAAIRYGEVDNALFFTSISGDRPYTARDFVSYLGKIMGNGIADPTSIGGTPSGPLCASGISGLDVTVGAGAAVLGGEYGYLAIQNTPEVISHVRPSVSARWDRVVLVLDNTQSERVIKFGVVQGTEGQPQASSASEGLDQNDVTNGGTYELLLFDVYVPTGTDPVTVDYTYSPYVQFETKINKVNDLESNKTSTVKYVTPNAINNWALPRSGGSLYPMTNTLYLGDQAIENTREIFGVVWSALKLRSKTGYGVQFLPNGVSSYTVEFSDTQAEFLTVINAGAGVRAQQGVGGYGLWVDSGEAIFDEKVTVKDELDMQNNIVRNGKTPTGDIGTASERVYTNFLGLLVDTNTNDNDGQTVTMSAPAQNAAYFRVTFGKSARNASLPNALPYGSKTVIVKASDLQDEQGGAQECSISSNFITETGDDIHIHIFRVERTGTYTLRFFRPQYTTAALSNIAEEPIYIFSIDALY